MKQRNLSFWIASGITLCFLATTKPIQAEPVSNASLCKNSSTPSRVEIGTMTASDLRQVLQNENTLKLALAEFKPEIQLKLDINKLETQEVELRNSNQSQLRAAINKLNVRVFQALCTSWCTTCEAWRQCGDCPADPSQC